MNTNEIKNTNTTNAKENAAVKESTAAQSNMTSETLYSEIPPISVEGDGANDGISVMCVGGSDGCMGGGTTTGGNTTGGATNGDSECHNPDCTCPECCGNGNIGIPVTSITITPSKLTITTDDLYLLKAVVLPSNATKKCVTWSSSNTNVAQVNPSSGTLHGYTVGETRIYATAKDGSGISGYCDVTVIPANNIMVISCESWGESSDIMGRDMSIAMQCEGSYEVEYPINPVDFKYCFDKSGECMIIHTHGNPNKLCGHASDGTQPTITTVDDLQRMSRNNNIKFIMMTACETAGGNAYNNVAYWLSKKINPNGLVIANIYKVTGGYTNFSAKGDDVYGWVAYRNGEILTADMPETLTMGGAYEIYKAYEVD